MKTMRVAIRVQSSLYRLRNDADFRKKFVTRAIRS